MGFEGILFTEQHGNLEGVHEVTNNPILLDLFIAAHTQSIKVGQCGICLPFANPLRVAEDIANLDQMTKGRALAGFSRGNTSRWADQYGQHLGMKVATSDKSETDERNFRAFAECWEIIHRAWTQDSFAFSGEFWTFPVSGTKYPYPPAMQWGDSVDSEGNLLSVGDVPRP
jgi:alkanesulfonate monooxygenase SsuD/methylene tetrahydromethanopterin reductase-like flavin-dependent oxidoreductase (luciferase family)